MRVPCGHIMPKYDLHRSNIGVYFIYKVFVVNCFSKIGPLLFSDSGFFRWGVFGSLNTSKLPRNARYGTHMKICDNKSFVNQSLPSQNQFDIK